MKLPYSIARILCAVAEAAARDMGVPMAIALADEEGSLQFFARMKGALPASSEIARSKAFTAASLRMPTDELGRLARSDGVLSGIQNTHGGRIILFGGGFPLWFDGEVVGAIGISGGTVEQDMRVAEPVTQAFVEMERWSENFRSVLTPGLRDTGWIHDLEESLALALEKEGLPLDRRELQILIGGVFLAACGN
ncbi:MAG: heme-binding protein [Deltaproteobacteria bacterium]|nr:heme-binding protein [Deltaproteobacteria bacterium]